jgi:hypothetical protein
MDELPLWVKGLGLAVALPLAVEVGYRLYAWTARRPTRQPEGDGRSWTMIVSAALTLLALLTSVTVSTAADRYDRRRLIVTDEVNAISTTYLRARLFAPLAGDRLSALTATYARDRRAVAPAGDDPRAIDLTSVQTEAEKLAIWAATENALRQPGAAVLTTPFLQRANQMFDLAVTRHAPLEARLPGRIVLLLAAYTAITAGMVRYGLGAGHRRDFAGSTLHFLMMAMTEVLILDLDRPGSGGVRASEEPVDRVIAAITQWGTLRTQQPHAASDHQEGISNDTP